tara:strand:+ start:24 stop:527 length:504 start_codon:yes stop_codon:yes gene_type:complete
MSDIINHEISIITNKRARKEMYCFLTKTNTCGKHFIEFNKPILINIQPTELIFMLELKNIATIKVKISDDYPFRTPSVYINNYEYKSLLCCRNTTDLTNTGSTVCLSYSSIVCHNNWGPHIHIIKILKEINDNYKIIRRLYERMLAKYVINNKPGHYVPIYLILDYL